MTIDDCAGNDVGLDYETKEEPKIEDLDFDEGDIVKIKYAESGNDNDLVNTVGLVKIKNEDHIGVQEEWPDALAKLKKEWPYPCTCLYTRFVRGYKVLQKEAVPLNKIKVFID